MFIKTHKNFNPKKIIDTAKNIAANIPSVIALVEFPVFAYSSEPAYAANDAKKQISIIAQTTITNLSF